MEPTHMRENTIKKEKKEKNKRKRSDNKTVFNFNIKIQDCCIFLCKNVFLYF